MSITGAIRLAVIGGLMAVGAASDEVSRGTGDHPMLPEIVVTPSRVPREIQSEPGTTYRMDGLDGALREANRTTPDALGGLPSVMVQKTGYGQGSPYLRGFTGLRTLCLVDGIRLNNSTFRDGPNQYWNTVDPLAIGHSELVMGPASVLYGSDAIGGVMNAIPAVPPAYRGGPTWDRRLYYRGAAADQSHVGRVELGGRPSPQVGFVGGISIKDFGDLEGGEEVGTQAHTGYDEQDGDLRLDGDIGGHARLTLGHQSVRQDDAWRTHRTVYAIDWEGLLKWDDQVHSYDQGRDLTYLRYRAEDLAGFVDGMIVTVSRHAQSEDLFRVRKDSTRDEQGFDVTAWGASLQLEGGSGAGDWVCGAEYYRDCVDSYARKYRADGSLGKTEIQGPVADDAAYDLAGVYIQDALTLLDGRLDVIPGARYTFARADADQVKDPLTGKVVSIADDWDDLAASLRLLHPLVSDRRHVVFAGIAQGFRAPNLSDLTRLDSARSNEIETPSPGLDPEQYVACEIGWRSRTQRLTTQMGAYYTFIDGMIVRTPTGRVLDDLYEVTKKNSGRGWVRGAECSTAYRFSAVWSSWVSLSWMDGELDAYPTSAAEQERDYISRLMPPTAQVGVRCQTETGKLWCEVVGDAAAKADKLSAEDRRDGQRIPPGGTPGYAVCTVRAGSQLMDSLALAVAVENVFDENYRIHGSGVNEPGRNLVLTANCVF